MIKTQLDELINKLLVYGSVVGVMLVGLSLWRLPAIGLQPGMIIQIVVGIGIVIMALARTRISYRTKVISLVLVFFSLGTGAMITAGFMGLGIEFFTLSIMFSTLLLDRRFSLRYTALVLVVLVLICYSVLSGYHVYKIDFNSYIHSTLLWVINLSSFIFLGIVAAFVSASILDMLRKNNENLHVINRELKEEIVERNKVESDRKTLQGLIPICSNCKQVRDDKGYWNRIESYIREHSDADFTHALCPECANKLYPEIFPTIMTDPEENV